MRVDTYRAGGAGGQYVNKTESAVRITHIPTGIVAQCQDEKSQLKNREKCMRVLRARILEQAQEEQRAATAEDRKSQVGTGDRSERIRTYNYPQGRVTDHRIGLTLHKLDSIVNGDLDELLSALITAKQSEQLRQVNKMDKPVWTIMKILNWTKQHFEAKGVENPRLDAEVLLCAVLKCERIKLYTEFDKPLARRSVTRCALM